MIRKKNKICISAFLILFLMIGTISCANSTQSDDTPPVIPTNNSDSDGICGTWAFDCGYNKEIWHLEQFTFNKDGTFEFFYNETGWEDIEQGTWIIEKNARGEKILVLHYTRSHNTDHPDWQNGDVRDYLKIISIENDEIVLNYFQCDKTNQGGDYDFFDPPLYQHYYRVKNGTKDFLTSGKWTVDPCRTPQIALNTNPFEETFTFNADGSMSDKYNDNQLPSPETYPGTYEVVEKDGKTLLHQILDCGRQPLDEVWYEFKSLGPNLINLNCISSTFAPEPLKEPIVNYYYRDVDLVKYTYHWKYNNVDYTFHDFWPKGEAYTLIDQSKRYYIHPLDGLPGNYANQEILGWYDNESLTGNPITSISAAENTTDRTFYVKWTLKGHLIGGKDWSCYSSRVPAKELIPDISFEAGKTISILFEADLSSDMNGWTQIKFWNSEHDDTIAFGQKTVNTSNKKLYMIYDVKTDYPSNEGDWFDFELVYNPESGSIVFNNYKFTILSNTNTYNINYHFGDVVFTDTGYTGNDFTLPTNLMYFEDKNWNIAHNLIFDGWVDGSGNPISKISAGSVSGGASKDVYLKLCPIFGEDDNSFGVDFSADLLSLSAVAGTTGEVRIQMTATLNKNPNPECMKSFWFEFLDWTGHEGWNPISGCGYEQIESSTMNGNEIKVIFKPILYEEKAGCKLPSKADEVLVNFGYNKEFCPELVKFSNLKFEILE